MSMLLMVKAMNIKVGNPLRKLVLVKLADNANDLGECWPSYNHIADQCEINRRSVMNHVKALEQMGLLRIERRQGAKGNTSNMFHLSLDNQPSELDSPAKKDTTLVKEIHHPSESDAPPLVKEIHPEPVNKEPVNEPVNLINGSSATNRAQSPAKKKFNYSDDFEALWGIRAKREGSDPKRKAYQAYQARLKEGVTHTELAQGLKRYVDYCQAISQDPKYIMQLSRFFGTGEEYANDWKVQPKQAANKQYSDVTARNIQNLAGGW